MLRGGVGTHPAGAPRPRGAGPRAGARRGWDGADPAPPAARPRPRAPARRAAALAIAQSDGLSSSAGLSILSVWREGLSMVCFRRVTNRGRGARGGAEIGGNARSPGWNASRGTPDAVHSAPPPPEARRTRPPLFTLRKHSVVRPSDRPGFDVPVSETGFFSRGGRPAGTVPGRGVKAFPRFPKAEKKKIRFRPPPPCRPAQEKTKKKNKRKNRPEKIPKPNPRDKQKGRGGRAATCRC